MVSLHLAGWPFAHRLPCLQGRADAPRLSGDAVAAATIIRFAHRADHIRSARSRLSQSRLFRSTGGHQTPARVPAVDFRGSHHLSPRPSPGAIRRSDRVRGVAARIGHPPRATARRLALIRGASALSAPFARLPAAPRSCPAVDERTARQPLMPVAASRALPRHQPSRARRALNVHRDDHHSERRMTAAECPDIGCRGLLPTREPVMNARTLKLCQSMRTSSPSSMHIPSLARPLPHPGRSSCSSSRPTTSPTSTTNKLRRASSWGSLPLTSACSSTTSTS